MKIAILCVAAAVLCGCYRATVYKIPVAIPPSNTTASLSEQSCIVAITRATALNGSYRKELKPKKSTAYRPVLRPTAGLPDDSYVRACMTVLQIVGMDNVSMHAKLDGKK